MTPRPSADMRRSRRGETVSQISQRSVARSTRGYQEEQSNSATYAEEYAVRRAYAPASRGVQASGRAIRTIVRKASRPLKPVAQRARIYAGQQIRDAMPRTTQAIRSVQQKKADAVRRFQTNMPKTAAAMRTTGRVIGATARGARRAAKPLARGIYQTGATAQAFVGATDAGFQSGAAATEAAMRTGASIAAKPMQRLASRGVKAAFKPARKLAARGLRAISRAVVKLMGKALLALGRALLSLIMSMGAPMILIIFFAVILVLIASPFGIFMGGSSPEKPSYTDAAAEIDAGLQERINEISRVNPHDALVVEFIGGSGGARLNNWPDILAVYATKTTTDRDNPLDVVEIDDEKMELLRAIWSDMTEIKHHTVTTRTKDEDTGDVETYTTLYISIIAKNRADMYIAYAFSEEQKSLTEELAQNEEFVALAQTISVSAYGSSGMQIGGQALPESAYASEIVRLAATRLGDPYSQARRGQDDYVDCSSLVQWAYYELGIKIPSTAAAQAKFCADNGYSVSKDNLQPGDLVFWSLKRDGEWIQPDRYMQVSHVGIYAGDGKVIEASSSAGQVVIRTLWGTQTMCARIL